MSRTYRDSDPSVETIPHQEPLVPPDFVWTLANWSFDALAAKLRDMGAEHELRALVGNLDFLNFYLVYLGRNGGLIPTDMNVTAVEVVRETIIRLSEMGSKFE